MAGRKRRRMKRKEYWVPEEIWRHIKSYTTLYVAPTREKVVYNALREWYYTHSQCKRKFGKKLLKIESYYIKKWKDGKTSRNYKWKHCHRKGHPTPNTLRATRELESMWFLHHGFYDKGISWIYLNPDGTKYVEVEKDILCSIHSMQRWYKIKEGKKSFFKYKGDIRYYRRYRKVGRMPASNGHWGDYNKNRGGFGIR